MYRTNANPPVETLHTKIVRPSKGADTTAALFAAALVFAVVLGAMLTLGASRRVDLFVACPVLVLSGLAFARARYRRRALRIERVGETHRLVVERDGITLEFPIRCHGTQVTTDPRMGVSQAYLQLVGANGSAVVLRETRGSLLRRAGWPDDIDRSVSNAWFDVSRPSDLAEVLDWVRRITG